jgi:hypothetical protein
VFNIVECEERHPWLYIYTPESEILIHYVLHLLKEYNETIDKIIISEPDLAEVFEKFQNKEDTKTLKKHVDQIKKVVFEQIGKKIPTQDILNILETHQWPQEIAQALIDKELKIINQRR